MFGRKVRLAALATSAAGVLVLAGCSAGDQVGSAPPAAERQDASVTPELMGAAPPPSAAQAQDGLLGGPAAAAQAQAQADASVAAPPPLPPSRNPHLKTWRRPDGTLVTAMRPIPNPKGSRHVATAQPHRVHATMHTAPAAVASVKPVTPKTVAPAPAPVKAAQPAKPAAPLAKPPVVAAVKPVAPVPAAKPATKLEKLQAAVAPEATNGAVLAAGESLAKNQPGQVTLSLPATLGDLIAKEAAKLGLGKAAKKTSAYAELSGEGYDVTPNGRQTAVVKPGEPTTFAWQVKPGPDAKGQLKSQFGLELNGGKEPQGFSLGEISKRVATLPEKAKKSFGDLDLGALNGSISLPGLGSTPIKTVLGVALVLLALIILVGVSRSAAAARRRAERQRKYRTLTDYGRNEMEFEQEAPASAHVSYVNPFVAAAGGAAAGAAVASAVSHHDDHHGHDSHGHGDHGHDDHAAHGDAHGHDDHGHHDSHGHDLHAGAHPEPHAPAEHVSYVNPMVAAASAHPVSHDDHGHHDHGHDDHGHEAHGHDDHGHGDHGHADHGHGHDNHGHDGHGHDAHHAKEPEHAH